MSKQEHDQVVAEYRSAAPMLDRPWYRCARRLLDKQGFRQQNCLDLCCGNAEFALILRDNYGMKVTCADYASLHLDHARTLGFDTLRVDLDADSTVVDARAMENADRFDLIVSLATIEHVFDSDNFLRFCWKILKPNGFLLLNTPNISFFGYRLYSFFSGNRPFGEGHHVRFWDYRFLRTNLFFNGFEVEEDFQRFFSLPEDILTRGFRNLKLLAKLVSTSFYLCYFLQHVPFMKGLVADELTLLCRKDDVLPVGFDYLTLKKKIEEASDPTRLEIINRLKIAKKRGWLREHINLSRLVDEYC